MAHSTATHSSPDVETQLRASLLVRQFRRLLGLTQEQFAARMGVTLPTINRWENDRSKPSPLALLRMKTMLIDLAQANPTDYQTGAAPTDYQAGAADLLIRYFAHDSKDQ